MSSDDEESGFRKDEPRRRHQRRGSDSEDEEADFGTLAYTSSSEDDDDSIAKTKKPLMKKLKLKPSKRNKIWPLIAWHPCCHAQRKTWAMLQFAENYYDWEVRRRNDIVFALACVGILLMIIELELAWTGEEMEVSFASEITKCLISASTVLLCFELYGVYKLQMTLLLARFNEGDKLKKMGLWTLPQLFWPFVVELCVCVVHPLPLAFFLASGPAQILVTDKIGLFMFVRGYLFLRVLRDHTMVYQKRVEIKKSGFMHSSAPPSFDCELAIKTFYYDNKVVSQFVVIATAWLVLAFCLYVCEREDQDEFRSITNVFWFTGVTMSTVGYGDIVPKTLPGRAMSLLTAFVGMVLSSLLTAVITQQVALKHHQQFAAAWVKKDNLRIREMDVAARFIQNEFRRYKMRKRIENEKWLPKRLLVKFRYLFGLYAAKRIYFATSLQSLRKQGLIESMSSDNPTFDRMIVLEKCFSNYEENQKCMMRRLDALEELKRNNVAIIHRLDMILKK